MVNGFILLNVTIYNGKLFWCENNLNAIQHGCM